MSFCPRCTATTFEGDKFCGTCGLLIAERTTFPELTQKSYGLEEVRYKLGVVYFKKGSYQEAYDIFEKILEQDPQHKDASEMVRLVRDKLAEI